MTRWFRMYDDVLNDPKAQKLSDAAFRGWVNIMCLASKNDGILEQPVENIAFSLRKSLPKTRELIQTLQSGGLLDRTENGWKPHNWETRQYKSDVSTARVKRFRECSRNVSETHPETEQTQSQKTEQKESSAAPAAAPPKPKAPQGTRWPAEQAVPENWFPPIIDRFRELGRAPPDLRLEAAKFAAYWASKSGKDATKIDWPKTFLNWCLNARTASGKADQRSFAERKFDSLKAGAGRAVAMDGEPGPGVESPTDNLIRLAASGVA